MFATALLARLPQGMASLAILLMVRERTGSYAAAGVAVGANAFASAAAAPLLGRLVDSFGRRAVLLPSACLQALALGGLVVAADVRAPAVVLVCLSAAGGALMPPVAPTVRALLREALPDPSVREAAYSLDSVVQEVIWTSGPLVVALVITLGSAAAAVLVCAAVWLGGTALFVASPLVASSPRRPPGSRRARALAIPQLRALLGPIALTGVGLGAIEVGLPSLALHAGSRAAAGLLLALWSVGSMTGGLWYGSRAWRAPLVRRYRGLLLAAVVLTAPLIAARTIPEGVACSLLAGLTCAPVFACQYSLIGRAVTPGVETEAFTWVAAALISGLAAGTALGGAVIGALGESAPFVLSCLATSAAALAAVRMAAPAAQRTAV
ncbi:MAG TPA: MFS transporter [Solirubrobacteraceae bacterium]|nr:MFS transporter [Solirubrobacteraceae bacterium]